MKISRTKYSSMTTPELLAVVDHQGLNSNELVRELTDRLADPRWEQSKYDKARVDSQMQLF